jgi:hypothetical protein
LTLDSCELYCLRDGEFNSEAEPPGQHTEDQHSLGELSVDRGHGRVQVEIEAAGTLARLVTPHVQAVNSEACQGPVLGIPVQAVLLKATCKVLGQSDSVNRCQKGRVGNTDAAGPSSLVFRAH